MAGLDWKKPKPLASSAGIRLRSDTSLTSMQQLDVAAASAAPVTPIGTSSVTTAISRLEVDAPVFARHRHVVASAPRKSSDPPWYISGSVQKLGGISAPRALRTSST